MKRLHYSAIFVSTVTILGISSLVGVVGYLQHEFTLNQEMHEVEKQALNVRQAIIDNFKAEDFAEINTKEDMDKPIYPAMQKLLNTIRISAGLRYLYTAKINSLGEYIYVIENGRTIRRDVITGLELAKRTQVFGVSVEEEVVKSTQGVAANSIIIRNKTE